MIKLLTLLMKKILDSQDYIITIKNAIEAGLLLMTEPDKPTFKNQRYYKNINI